jgi:hypothetical protein
MASPNAPQWPIEDWLILSRSTQRLAGCRLGSSACKIQPAANPSMSCQSRQRQGKFYSNYHAKTFSPANTCSALHSDGTDKTSKVEPQI